MGAGATENDVDEMMSILDLHPMTPSALTGTGSAGSGSVLENLSGPSSARLDLDKDASDARDRQITCSSEQFVKGMKNFLTKENESALEKFKAAARKVSNELGVIRVLRGAFASPSHTPRNPSPGVPDAMGSEADEYGGYGQQHLADGASVNSGTPVTNNTPINSARTSMNSARGPMSARLNMFMYARGAYQPQRSMLPNSPRGMLDIEVTGRDGMRADSFDPIMTARLDTARSNLMLSPRLGGSSNTGQSQYSPASSSLHKQKYHDNNNHHPSSSSSNHHNYHNNNEYSGKQGNNSQTGSASGRSPVGGGGGGYSITKHLSNIDENGDIPGGQGSDHGDNASEMEENDSVYR